MIIEERRNEVEQSGTINTAAFRIDREETAHILGLLSSKLYSNKIQTAIRELCSNAWDAHVAAGNENIPFEVHLPNSLSPEFKVRDFGISMTN
jgi:HSP90 family molecular chaperone